MNADESRARLPVALVSAIGSVAVASAELEDALRATTADLAGVLATDAARLLFEGQSMDWLIANGKTLAADDVWSPHPRGYRREIRELLSEAARLKDERNVVMHGQWSADCSRGYWEDDQCEPHSPRTDEHRGDVYHVSRSRYRKYAMEQRWAVAEVSGLADRLWVVTTRLDELRELNERTIGAP
ncbi:hypothetical protein [Nocardia transvalensis]|uniref:hypothetical protein n=1 Tax=Nocardia transvalensis TaxID=37333 RepID=UPI00189617DE|nr:hypothetical protein [Nocardia transvalensis]MBF6334246.1 hypothetical protein [Nocardia transvalensis]